MNKRTSERTAIFFVIFAGFGLALSAAAFLSSLAGSGYASPSWRNVVLGIAAFWPSIACGFALVGVGIFNSLKDFAAAAPMLYTFGLPAIGWGLIGALIAWFSRARSAEDKAQTARQS